MIYNANKKSVTVDLKTERGIALVKEMAGHADVFVENMAPGTIERLVSAGRCCTPSTRA